MPPKHAHAASRKPARDAPAATPPSAPVPLAATAGVSASAAAAPVIPLPLRAGFGREGKAIKLLANHFSVNQAALPESVVRYFVEVIAPARPPPRGGEPLPPPRALPKALCRMLLSRVAASRSWGAAWAYDGQSTLYGARELLPDSRGGEAVLISVLHKDSRGREEDFTVRVRALGALPIRAAVAAFLAAPGVALPAEAIAALDTVARQRRASDPQKWVVAGRNLVTRELVRELGAGLEVWLGYSLSVRPTQPSAGLSLSAVVDRAAAAFVKAQSVENYIAAVTNFKEPRVGTREWAKAHKALRGIKVVIQPGDNTTRREYRARGLSRLPASQCVFPNDDLGRQDDVVSYFERKLGRRLNYPGLPCVDVSRSSAKPILLPIELCSVVAGQRRTLVDDPIASAAMIKATALRPAERKAAIIDSVAKHVAQDATMAAFGLAVAPEMRKLSGRVLSPPLLQYARSTVTPQDGKWDLRGTSLRLPPPAAKRPRAWAAVCVDRAHAAELRAFLQPFMQSLLATAGFALPAVPTVVTPHAGESLENTLRRAAHGTPALPVGFVLCVLPDSGSDSYARVKAMFDKQLGIVSQCMLPKHLGGGGPRGAPRGGPAPGRGAPARGGGGGGGPNPQYLANLALKINAKLGGTNVVVAPPRAGAFAIPGLSEEPTMLFGADVSHPAPGSGSPSFVAVVGSLDAHAARYATRLATQPGTQEHISALQSMSAELLQEFRASTGGHKPQRIVFFRDGVSEGQFQQILRTELPALRDAFASMGDGSYRPRLTFIVLQKRHQTRLFVESERDADRSSGNVPAGTVVDTDICHPSENDFYLVSHAGLQGTSRPVHYHVLLDENGFGADALQRMAWSLCHVYCRCTRSVSLVPPVYYAHLAAFRARVLHGAEGGSDTESVLSGGAAAGVAAAGGAPLDVHASLQQSMFFV